MYCDPDTVQGSEGAKEIKPGLALEKFMLLLGSQTSMKVEAISATTNLIPNTFSGLYFSYILVPQSFQPRNQTHVSWVSGKEPAPPGKLSSGYSWQFHEVHIFPTFYYERDRIRIEVRSQSQDVGSASRPRFPFPLLSSPQTMQDRLRARSKCPVMTWMTFMFEPREGKSRKSSQGSWNLHWSEEWKR